MFLKGSKKIINNLLPPLPLLFRRGFFFQNKLTAFELSYLSIVETNSYLWYKVPLILSHLILGGYNEKPVAKFTNTKPIFIRRR